MTDLGDWFPLHNVNSDFGEHGRDNDNGPSLVLLLPQPMVDWSRYLFQCIKIRTIRCRSMGGVEHAKYIDIEDLLEVVIGKLKSWLDDRGRGILNTQSFK